MFSAVALLVQTAGYTRIQMTPPARAAIIHGTSLITFRTSQRRRIRANNMNLHFLGLMVRRHP